MLTSIELALPSRRASSGVLWPSEGRVFGLARRHISLGEVQSSVRVNAHVTRCLARGSVRGPKTDAGVRVVSLPERVRSELLVHLRDFVPDDPEALLFADEASGDVPSHRSGNESGIRLGTMPAYRISPSTISDTLPARSPRWQEEHSRRFRHGSATRHPTRP